jgi:hypothetical protein
VGEYFADLLVEDAVVVELKCVERLANEHQPNVSTICGRQAGPSAFSRQFPEAQSRVEANRSGLC